MDSLRVRQKLVRNRVVRAAIRPALPRTSRADMQRLGTPYGGWWVPVGLLDAESIVYSVGIGGDASFDLELMDRFGCHVWGFDPARQGRRAAGRGRRCGTLNPSASGRAPTR